MKQNANISVVISGEANTGKSTIAQLLITQLVTRGVAVTLNLENPFTAFTSSTDIDQKVEAFNKGGCMVTVEEHQIARTPEVEKENQIKKALKLLEENGYMVQNLWTTEDVRRIMFEESLSETLSIDNEKCLFILNSCINSDYQRGEINASIKDSLHNL